MSISKLDQLVFGDFCDLIRKPEPKKVRKCMRCPAPASGDRLCNKCRKFVQNQSKMAQSSGYRFMD